ncbi:hypothetical protein C1J03_01410 [Sulfitobacter sp. SK012]|uniref:hypothetical protein n=1 Tax=Sulfitobacter sp. SK012 TaxID=1389005 RepID=UPI000E0A95B5|nr:hypothetical protein [Sulfitobacter sp. SK012]AXI44804.1 hypothetical protein C1J03_01410 [Sulfitobacter sp. SK012]
MGRTFALFIIGLVFGGGIGFVLAAGNGITFDGHDHGDASQHDGMDHAKTHETPLEILAANAPEITLAVTPDPMTGYNLHLTTQNFTFAPEAASLADVAGEGHAHVYINGEKLARLYGPWMHLNALPVGDVEVQVTLNSNDHRALSVAGTPITATVQLSVPE